MLYRIRRANQTWRTYPLFLLSENRWRAQRYGVAGTLFDFGKGELVAFRDLVEELLVLLREDAEALGCLSEIEHARTIVAARHQRRPAGGLLREAHRRRRLARDSAQGRRRSPHRRNRRHRSRQVSRAPMPANIRPAKPILAVLAAVAVAGTMAAHAADRAQATVACKPAGVWLAYDCTVKLANATTGAPLQKAQLTIGADMPSRPLADKVAPVAAKATATPGEYRAIVVLEVHGDWALRLNVAAGPIKNQLTELLNFGPKEVGPAKNPNPTLLQPLPRPRGAPSPEGAWVSSGHAIAARSQLQHESDAPFDRQPVRGSDDPIELDDGLIGSDFQMLRHLTRRRDGIETLRYPAQGQTMCAGKRQQIVSDLTIRFETGEAT